MAGAKCCVVFVTAPSLEVAKNIAKGLLSNKLAACVNVVPGIVSLYQWEDKMCQDNEVLMMIKSRSSSFDTLSSFVKSNHPYDCVEVISSEIAQGNAPYMDWIRDNVKDLMVENSE